jgi:hypothetical protein
MEVFLCPWTLSHGVYVKNRCEHMKLSILVDNNKEVSIVEDNAWLGGATTPNLQANVMSIQECEALRKDVVNDRPSEENKTLGNVS